MVIHPITVNTILYCRHWDDMVRFYRDRLRLPVIFSNEWFMEFRLAHNARLSIADERRSSVKSAAGRGITLTLEVVAIEPVHRQMQDVGLKPTGIREHPWNARVFRLFDPEGNRLEVWQADTTGPAVVVDRA
ncbi:MAG: VOC family protein [Desulfosarcina sp.]|jgi:catechol 2,3-dioxygenase-like lactoylglutathione lyase family enzyme